jgi:membrane protease YdiL (CAAX protease family)
MRRFATFHPSAHRARAGGPGLPQMAGLTLALVGPPVVASIGRPAVGDAPSLAVGLAGQAALVVLAATVLAMLRRWQCQPLTSIGLCPLRARSVALALVLVLFFRFVFLPFTSFVLTSLGIGGWDTGVAALGALPIWYLTLAVIIGPTVEEILYRGYAIHTLASITGSNPLAVLVSTVAFGLAHVPGWGWGPATSATLSGAVAALFYVWTRDLNALILSHVVTDFVGIVVPNIR